MLRGLALCGLIMYGLVLRLGPRWQHDAHAKGRGWRNRGTPSHFSRAALRFGSVWVRSVLVDFVWVGYVWVGSAGWLCGLSARVGSRRACERVASPPPPREEAPRSLVEARRGRLALALRVLALRVSYVRVGSAGWLRGLPLRVGSKGWLCVGWFCCRLAMCRSALRVGSLAGWLSVGWPCVPALRAPPPRKSGSARVGARQSQPALLFCPTSPTTPHTTAHRRPKVQETCRRSQPPESKHRSQNREP